MNYADSILDAVDILIDKKLSNLPYDKTVRATILSIEDESLLKYKVKYQNATVYAYATDADQSYKVNDEIYLQVPSNDFNKSPLIIGKVLKTPVIIQRTLTNTDLSIPFGDNLVSTNHINANKSENGLSLKADLINRYSDDSYFDSLHLTAILTAAERLIDDKLNIYLYDGTTKYLLDELIFAQGITNTSIDRIYTWPAQLKKTLDNYVIIFQTSAADHIISITDINLYVVDYLNYPVNQYSGSTLNIGILEDTRSNNAAEGNVTLQAYFKVNGFTLSLDELNNYSWYIRDDKPEENDINGVGWQLLSTGTNKLTLANCVTDVTVMCVVTYLGQDFTKIFNLTSVTSELLSLSVKLGTQEITAPISFDQRQTFILSATNKSGFTYYWSYVDNVINLIDSSTQSTLSWNHKFDNNLISIEISCTLYDAAGQFYGRVHKTIYNQAQNYAGLQFLAGSDSAAQIVYDDLGNRLTANKTYNLQINFSDINGVTPTSGVTYRIEYDRNSCLNNVYATLVNNIYQITFTFAEQIQDINQITNNNNITIIANYVDVDYSLVTDIEVAKQGDQNAITAYRYATIVTNNTYNEFFYRESVGYLVNPTGSALTNYTVQLNDGTRTTHAFPITFVAPLRDSGLSNNGVTYYSSKAIQVINSTNFYITNGYRDVVYNVDGSLIQYNNTPFRINNNNTVQWKASWLSETQSGPSATFEPPYIFDPTQTYTITAQGSNNRTAVIYLNFYMNRDLYGTDNTWNGITTHNNLYYPAWSVAGSYSAAAAGLTSGKQVNLLLDNVLINGTQTIPTYITLSQNQITDRGDTSHDVVTSSNQYSLNVTNTTLQQPSLSLITTPLYAYADAAGTTLQQFTVVTGVQLNWDNDMSLLTSASLQTTAETKATIYSFNNP